MLPGKAIMYLQLFPWQPGILYNRMALSFSELTFIRCLHLLEIFKSMSENPKFPGTFIGKIQAGCHLDEILDWWFLVPVSARPVKDPTH